MIARLKKLGPIMLGHFIGFMMGSAYIGFLVGMKAL